MARRHASRASPSPESRARCASGLTPASFAANPQASAVISLGCLTPGRAARPPCGIRSCSTHLRAVETVLRNAEVRVVPGRGGTRWEQIDLPRAVRQRSPRRVFCARLHRAPHLDDPDRRPRSRHLVRRASGMVSMEGRPSPPAHHAMVESPRAAGVDGVGERATRNHVVTSVWLRSACAAFIRASLASLRSSATARPRPTHASRWCCSSAPSSTGATFPI